MPVPTVLLPQSCLPWGRPRKQRPGGKKSKPRHLLPASGERGLTQSQGQQTGGFPPRVLSLAGYGSGRPACPPSSSAGAEILIGAWGLTKPIAVVSPQG